MRLIDADKFKWQVAAVVIKGNLPVEKVNTMLKLIDMQPTAINGKIIEAEYAYQRITYINPVEHHYEEPGEKPYIKYGCPVCEALGNLHQVTPGEENCPLCGVNFNWKIEDKMDEKINVNQLIEEFSDMANRGSLLTGDITQEDLLIQIIGTIAKVALKQ